MKNRKGNVGLIALLLVVIGVGFYWFYTKPKTINPTNTTSNNVVTPPTEENLNDSSGIGTAVNPDGTMGPATSKGNYSNSLPASSKGNLSFYVTDPMPPSVQGKLSVTKILPPQATENSQKGNRPNSGATLTSLLLKINKVEVHLSSLAEPTVAPTGANNDKWETLNIGTVPQTVDLVALAASKSSQLLGLTTLAAGHYTEVRLYVVSATAKYSDGAVVNLDILGKDNIVRIVRSFNIEAGKKVTMTMDFKADKSVVKAGDKYILKPVVGKLDVVNE